MRSEGYYTELVEDKVDFSMERMSDIKVTGNCNNLDKCTSKEICVKKSQPENLIPTTSTDNYLSGLQQFWEENYVQVEPSTTARVLPADIYDYYKQSRWHRQELYKIFVRLSSIIMGST